MVERGVARFERAWLHRDRSDPRAYGWWSACRARSSL